MESIATLARPSDASFLGLPRELRLQVYQHVFDLDLDCIILDCWRDTHTQNHGFKSVPDLNVESKLIIPWLNLMLTCKTFAVELRAAMRENRFADTKRNVTWMLDLEATRGGMTLGTTSWQRIPCPPDQVQILEAYYNASRGFQAWGVGSPHGITSGLYQTLNHIIHCGPRFDSRHPLPKPMHIKELRVKVESRDKADRVYDDDHYMTLSDRDTDPHTTLIALGSIVGQIVRTGVLQGFVDRIRVFTADKELSWTPKDVEGEGIPEYWNRYGFDWGMILYQNPQ
ncbi:hypothetical protein HII31_04102 [Pseudocercospora fuligena]|uniref:Uncharacterized protein n=1 Tax=Pseudocercospora fuligena TaxID=685502 RepID=A0A8H6RLI2_9PEZI|nr:hypothetical protein HII31_04102 [Pseudocercospora fuligena]